MCSVVWCLSGSDMAHDHLVCRRWEGLLDTFEETLLAIELDKVHIRQHKIRIEDATCRFAIEVEVVERRKLFTYSAAEGTYFPAGYEYGSMAFTVGSQRELYGRLIGLIRAAHIRSFHFENVLLRFSFVLDLEKIAPTVSVEELAFANVTFSDMKVPEFLWLFYAFKKIESLNLETSIVPSAAIDNRLLLGLATSGVRRLCLPKFYPTDSEQYVVNLEGISDFLSYAPEGTIELTARYLYSTCRK
ncbi:hypothetical protein AAVH_29877 [Aphelenchoides avenae]|nr:hypothetical protein AAVH_29877 [Aphelenchus avenae]